MITATRYHDFSAGHRVYGHESKCAHLHGHNYRVHFTVEAALDRVGRVMDFSAIKDRLCQWLENNWDHKMLLWQEDPYILDVDKRDVLDPGALVGDPSVVPVPFNPTAESMADYLLRTVGPAQLEGTGVRLIRVVIEETRKCSATSEL